MKICTNCKLERPFEQFSKNKSRKDGLNIWCKSCAKEYKKKNAEKNKERNNHWRQKNKDKIKLQTKLYRKTHATEIRLYKYYYTKTRRKMDPLFKFSCHIKNLIKDSFKRNKTRKFKKQSKSEKLLGCSIPELRDHLAKQFQKGMTFENHGQWHIDHIIPLASAKTQEEVEKLCHYTNLQPLWAKDNLSKGKKLIY